MRQAAGAIGLILMLLGIAALVSATSNDRDPGAGSWTCTVETPMKQDCAFDGGRSPQQLTVDTATDIENTIAAAAIVLAGAALVGGSVAASRPKQYAPIPGSYNYPPQGGYPTQGYPPGGPTG